MNKKKIIKRKYIPSYYECRKWENIKVVNFSYFDDFLNEMVFPIWIMKKHKVEVKKPFIYYIGKMSIDEYTKMKPRKYEYAWTCIMHSGTCPNKIKDWEHYKNFEAHLNNLVK